MKEISKIKPQCPFKTSSIQPTKNLTTSCPNTDLSKPPKSITKNEKNDFCSHHKHIAPTVFSISKDLDEYSIFSSKSTGPLLTDIGGGDRIREFCTRFYSRMFVDDHLKQFIFETDGAEAHGKRLGDWIIEKMGCKLEGEPWTESGRYGQRQPSHFKSWNNDKRKPNVRGQHFKLDDSRIWIRLHFWAARECGLSEHGPFWNWYKEVMSEFIAIYESRASKFVEEDAEWSSKKQNVQKYLHDGNVMKDIVGKR
jgi:hypothetical protein